MTYAIVVLSLWNIILTVFMAYLVRKNTEVLREWNFHQKARQAWYAALADPEKIEADMEKSARAREMYDAQRSTLPRQGAWPPAKVYRPKLRGAKPGRWRIPRP